MWLHQTEMCCKCKKKKKIHTHMHQIFRLSAKTECKISWFSYWFYVAYNGLNIIMGFTSSFLLFYVTTRKFKNKYVVMLYFYWTAFTYSVYRTVFTKATGWHCFSTKLIKPEHFPGRGKTHRHRHAHTNTHQQK